MIPTSASAIRERLRELLLREGGFAETSAAHAPRCEKLLGFRERVRCVLAFLVELLTDCVLVPEVLLCCSAHHSRRIEPIALPRKATFDHPREDRARPWRSFAASSLSTRFGMTVNGTKSS